MLKNPLKNKKKGTSKLKLANDGIDVTPIHSKLPSIYDNVGQQNVDNILQKTAPSYQVKPYWDETPYDYSGAIASGITAIDALLPNKKPKPAIITPQATAPQNPFGTNSQAIAKKGAKMYKSKSYDGGGTVDDKKMTLASNTHSYMPSDYKPFGDEKIGKDAGWYPIQRGTGVSTGQVKYKNDYGLLGDIELGEGKGKGYIGLAGNTNGLFDLSIYDENENPVQLLAKSQPYAEINKYLTNNYGVVKQRVDNIKNGTNKDANPADEQLAKSLITKNMKNGGRIKADGGKKLKPEDLIQNNSEITYGTPKITKQLPNIVNNNITTIGPERYKSSYDLQQEEYKKQQYYKDNMLDEKGNSTWVNDIATNKHLDKFVNSVSAPVEAASYIEGAGELYQIGKPLLKQAGKYLTEKTILKDAYKINPLSNKTPWYDDFHLGQLSNTIPEISGEYIHRNVGNGLDDFFNTGILRNKKSAGLPLNKRSQNYGERVFFGDTKGGNSILDNGTPRVVVKNSAELKNRPVTFSDVEDVIVTENGEQISLSNWKDKLNPNLKNIDNSANWLKGYKKLPKQENGGKLKAKDGLYIEDNKFSQLSPSTLQVNGDTHADGGTDVHFNGTTVEAQKGEPLSMNKEGGVTLFGKLENPLTGRTFEKDAKELAKKEVKIKKYLDEGTELLSYNSNNKWDMLKFNAGKAMFSGATAKLKEIDDSREHLSDVQTAMLDTKEEKTGKAKFGKFIAADGVDISKEKAINTAKNFYRKDGSYQENNGLWNFLDVNLENGNDVKNKIAQFYKLQGQYNPNSSLYSYIDENINPSVAPIGNKKPSLFNPDISPLQMRNDVPSYDVIDNASQDNSVMDAANEHPLKLNYLPYNNNAPTNAKNLSFGQILPELYTAATNQLEPVQMQQYSPETSQPYQVSFDDRRNQVTSTFRASQQYLGDNPAAQSSVAAQAFEAHNNINADEFRTNQGIANDVRNKNISLINDAKLKNLQLADNQYGRQEQAKSNTKTQNRVVLQSIADKLHQNELEKQTIKLYENNTNFRFNPQTGKSEYYGAPGAELIDWNVYENLPKADQTRYLQEVTKKYDKNGILLNSEAKTKEAFVPSYGKNKKKFGGNIPALLKKYN